MKRKNNLIFGICTIAIVAIAFFIFDNQTQPPPAQQTIQEEKKITAQEAKGEISFIDISAEETEFLQQIVKCDEVVKTLQGGKDDTLDVKVANNLAKEYLIDDLNISDFSVINKSVYVDYFVNEYRIIYQVEKDGTTHKFVGVHDENKNAKALYENVDNKSYKKVVFSTVTK